jgi:hypothetical protein
MHAQTELPLAITRPVDQAPPTAFQPLSTGDCSSNDRPTVVSEPLLS